MFGFGGEFLDGDYGVCFVWRVLNKEFLKLGYDFTVYWVRFFLLSLEVMGFFFLFLDEFLKINEKDNSLF